MNLNSLRKNLSTLVETNSGYIDNTLIKMGNGLPAAMKMAANMLISIMPDKPSSVLLKYILTLKDEELLKAYQYLLSIIDYIQKDVYPPNGEILPVLEVGEENDAEATKPV